jgi:hypothetical protein
VLRGDRELASWAVLASTTVLAAGVAGALAGAIVGGFGAFVPLDVRVVLGMTGALLLIVAACLPRLGVLQWDRETKQELLVRGPLVWAMLNGALLGVGVTSRLGFWIWYTVPLCAFVLGVPAAGAVIWGGYSVARLVLAIALSFAMRRRPGAAVSLADTLIVQRSRARQGTNAVLTVLMVAMILVLGL